MNEVRYCACCCCFVQLSGGVSLSTTECVFNNTTVRRSGRNNSLLFREKNLHVCALVKFQRH